MVAPWAADIGALLPVPEELANDVPLALFGASAIIAGALALVVLPETRGKKSSETISDAVLELHTLALQHDDPAYKIASVLGGAIGVGVSILVGFVVQAATGSVLGGVGAGIGLAVVLLAVVMLCYRSVGLPVKNWRELHRQKGKRCFCC